MSDLERQEFVNKLLAGLRSPEVPLDADFWGWTRAEDREQLEAELLAGLEGPTTILDEAEWTRMRQEAWARAGRTRQA